MILGKDRYRHYEGQTIEILNMEGEPHYTGKIGVVEYVDDIGQLHGTWGGLAVNPDIDSFRVVKSKEEK